MKQEYFPEISGLLSAIEQGSVSRETVSTLKNHPNPEIRFLGDVLDNEAEKTRSGIRSCVLEISFREIAKEFVSWDAVQGLSEKECFNAFASVAGERTANDFAENVRRNVQIDENLEEIFLEAVAESVMDAQNILPDDFVERFERSLEERASNLVER